jgi:hypothetical protein
MARPSLNQTGHPAVAAGEIGVEGLLQVVAASVDAVR